MQRLFSIVGVAFVLLLVATCAPSSTQGTSEQALTKATQALALAGNLDFRLSELEGRTTPEYVVSDNGGDARIADLEARIERLERSSGR